eukprot:PhM_4_TR1702/c0_g1_i2/m.34392/K05609/UCHL3, YUH1; ubiquitin carboxyl-terminal hydrolase L3
MSTKEKQRWFPLESNPDVMTRYLARLLGCKDERSLTHAFHDVFGFDEELLTLVPTPVRAVLALYPLTPENEALAAQDVEKQQQQQQQHDASSSKLPYFLRQYVGNACGTVAILHALANTPRHELGGCIAPDSFASAFLNETMEMTPEQRGAYLEESKALCDAHELACQSGQTEVPSKDDRLTLHFICYVNCGGVLYELDGRKGCALARGATTDETLLKDACAQVQALMALNPAEQNFTVVAYSAMTN